MLEIIVVILLCTQMGKLMRRKGRKPLLFQVMLVFFWLGGEIGVSIAYAIGYAVATGNSPDVGFELMLIALAGGGLGAALAFVIAALIPVAETAAAGGQYERYAQADLQNIKIPPPSDPNNPYQPPSA